MLKWKSGDKIYGSKIKNVSLIVLLTIAGILCLPVPSFGQEVKVDAKLDSTNILIGDHTGLSLKLIQPDSIDIVFPLFTDTIKTKIEIIDQKLADTTKLDNNKIEVVKRYRITCFDTGYYHIPPFVFKHIEDSLISNWATKPLFLNVSRVNIAPADSTDTIFNIKLPAKMPLSFSEILPWILGVVIVGGLIYFIVLYFRKRKAKEPIFRIEKPEEPPHVIALRELDQLKGKKLWQKGKIKAYHSELTFILRKYIERRYKVAALEQTSNEIIENLSMVGFNNNKQMEHLKSILFSADLVKFAKVIPQPDENEKSLLNSYIFINETKQTWQKELDEQKSEIQENNKKQITNNL